VLSATRWQAATGEVTGRPNGWRWPVDYLRSRFREQPEPVRDFLLRTSPPEEFDADLCRAVLGAETDWRTLMDAVLLNDLFVMPVGDGQSCCVTTSLPRFSTGDLAQNAEEHARI